MRTARCGGAALALAVLLAGCENEPAAPAPTPSPSVTATPEANTVAGGRLAAAVAAAFPDGAALQDENGTRYAFADHQLVDAPSGPVLVSEGEGQEAAHAAAGRLDVTYLQPDGAGFTVVRRFPAAIEIGGFGRIGAWSVDTALADVPTVRAEGAFTAQGYTCGRLLLTELRAGGPIEVANIQTVYDNAGAAPADQAETYEGAIVDASPDGFTVRFTGTRGFNEHWTRANGRWVRRDEQQLPEC